MGAHLIEHEGRITFQSDKYPTTPPGKVPLSVKDPDAQPLLWQYAQRHRRRDPEFSADLEEALRVAGFQPPRVGPPRYFQFGAHTADDADDIQYHVVARDLMHALELMSAVDLGDWAKIAGCEITAEEAETIATSEDEPGQNRDKLTKWPIGSVLCDEF